MSFQVQEKTDIPEAVAAANTCLFFVIADLCYFLSYDLCTKCILIEQQDVAALNLRSISIAKSSGFTPHLWSNPGEHLLLRLAGVGWGMRAFCPL